MQITELTAESGLSSETIWKYVEIGLLPPPTGYGRWAKYSPECSRILRELRFVREYLFATVEELAERRQSTGSLLPNFDHLKRIAP